MSWLNLSAKDKTLALDAIRADLTRVQAQVRERNEVLSSSEPRNIGTNNAVYLGDLVEPTLAPLEAAVSFLEAPCGVGLAEVCKAVGCRCGQLSCALEKIVDLKEDRAQLHRLEDIEQEVLRKDLAIEIMRKALEWFASSLSNPNSAEFAQDTLDSVKKQLEQP